MVRAFADQHDKEKRGRHMSIKEEENDKPLF